MKILKSLLLLLFFTNISCLSTPLREYPHGWDVKSIFFSLDSRWIISSALDNTVRIRDVQTGKLIGGLKEHTGALALSPDGKMFAVSTISRQIGSVLQIWKFAGNTPFQQIKLNNLAGIISFSPDGKLIAVPSHEGVTLFEIDTGIEKGSVDPDTQGYIIAGIAFNQDGKQIATICQLCGKETGKILVFDVQSRKLLKTINIDVGNTGSGLVYTKDGKSLVFAGYSREMGMSSIGIFDIASGNIKYITAFKPGFQYNIWAISVSKDSEYVVSGSAQGMIAVWNLKTYTLVREFKGHSQPVIAIDISPDRKWIASGGMDSTIKLWNFSELQ